MFCSSENRLTFDAATEICSILSINKFRTWALLLLSNIKRNTPAETRQWSTVYTTNTMQNWHDIYEPGFWGVKIQRNIRMRANFHNFPQTKNTGCIDRSKGEGGYQKAAYIYIYNTWCSFLHSSGLFDH